MFKSDTVGSASPVSTLNTLVHGFHHEELPDNDRGGFYFLSRGNGYIWK